MNNNSRERRHLGCRYRQEACSSSANRAMPQYYPYSTKSGLAWATVGTGLWEFPYGNSHGYGYGMGMGTVMNSMGTVGILWGFLSGCKIKRKRVKYAINVTVDV